jgi:hypothetical protein
MKAPVRAAGYSGTPLAKKLGYKADSRACLIGAPDHYADLVDPLPGPVAFGKAATAETDLVHVFTAKRADLEKHLGALRKKLGDEATVWISWPKKASKVPTDITEDVIREVALPMGFVDVKVCAVDETWSGLKLVVRKALRGKATA